MHLLCNSDQFLLFFWTKVDLITTRVECCSWMLKGIVFSESCIYCPYGWCFCDVIFLLIAQVQEKMYSEVNPRVIYIWSGRCQDVQRIGHNATNLDVSHPRRNILLWEDRSWEIQWLSLFTVKRSLKTFFQCFSGSNGDLHMSELVAAVYQQVLCFLEDLGCRQGGNTCLLTYLFKVFGLT